jgi:hypothetical protein
MGLVSSELQFPYSNGGGHQRLVGRAMHRRPCCRRLLTPKNFPLKEQDEPAWVYGLVLGPSQDGGGEFLDPVASLPIFDDLFSLRPFCLE